MCQANILAGKHNANPMNILVHLQLLCAQRRHVVRSWGFGLVGGKQEQAIENSLMTSQFKVLFHLLPFGHNVKGVF